MNVHGVGNGINHRTAIGLIRPPDRILGEPEEIGIPEGDLSPDAVGDDQSTTESDQGVLRLLQEGHFKGVADVRLRINFHEAVAAAESEALSEVANEKVPAIAAAIVTQTEMLLTSGDLSDEQIVAVTEPLETFDAGVAGLTDVFLSDEHPSSDNLVSAVQSAFDTLMDSLHTILNQNSPTEPGGTATENASPDPTPGFQPFLDTIAESFTIALADMVDALNSTVYLPELSAPEGNGAAYDKFVAIYNELRGAVEIPDVPDEQSVNVIA